MASFDRKLKEGEKSVIFSTNEDMETILKKNKIKYVLVSRKQSESERKKLVEKYNSGKIGVISMFKYNN